MSGLEGVNVLELGTMVSAAYATKLMADLGANVINGRVSGSGLALPHAPGKNPMYVFTPSDRLCSIVRPDHTFPSQSSRHVVRL